MLRSEVAPGDEEFFDVVVERLDREFYLKIYPDVAAAGVDPVDHWLRYGLGEGRQMSPLVGVRCGRAARRSTGRNWRHYRWHGEDVALQLIDPIPPAIMTQIRHQARHDPEALAAGLDATANVGPRESLAVIDVVGLRRAIPHPAEFLLVVPHLGASSSRGLASILVAALQRGGFGSIQTVLTEEELPEDFDPGSLPDPLSTNVVSWRNFWVRDPGPPKFAQLIWLLRPRVLIVAGSRLGYEVVARYGRALSEHSKIYCLYGDADESSDFAAHFPRRTLPFATALTDDAATAARLREQYGELLGHGVVLLPARPDDGADGRHSPGFAEAVLALFGPR